MPLGNQQRKRKLVAMRATMSPTQENNLYLYSTNNNMEEFFFLVKLRPFSGFTVKIICASVYRKRNDRSLYEK